MFQVLFYSFMTHFFISLRKNNEIFIHFLEFSLFRTKQKTIFHIYFEVSYTKCNDYYKTEVASALLIELKMQWNNVHA